MEKVGPKFSKEVINVVMYQNTLNQSSLEIDCTNMECHIRIDSHRHFGSQAHLLLANDNSKQTVIITNTISTGEMTRDDFTAIQFYIECSNIWNGLVQINNYIFGDSIMVGVRILNIAKVYILNTQFRNIQVIREMKDLGQCSKFAAGLTAVSSLVNMKNTTFSNVSAESVVPSSIYVDIKSVYGLPNQLIMNNVIVGTTLKKVETT